MLVESVPRILFLVAVVAMLSAIVGCAKPVEEADVVGTYVKDTEEPLKFYTSETLVQLGDTDGKVSLTLKAGGQAEIDSVPQPLPWRLENGKVTLYLFNASSSGDVKGDKIIGLGGEGVVWTKK